MTAVQRPELGAWWRFSEYRIVAGRIEPAPGAKLEEYDPWVDYRRARSRGGGQEPPYQSLLSLLEEVSFRQQGSGYAVRPESEGRITEWCARHGLLGLLPQLAWAIWLPAQAEARVPATGVTVHDVLHLSLPSYRRSSAGWILDVEVVGCPEKEHRGVIEDLIEGGHLEIRDDPEEGQEGFVYYAGHLPSELVKKLAPSRSRTNWRPGVTDTAHNWYPLTKMTKAYMPSLPTEEQEWFYYPQPLSSEFWQVYSEPVEEFIMRAQGLREVMEVICAADLPSVSPGVRMEDDQVWRDEHGDLRFWAAKEVMDSITGSVSRVLALDHGQRLRQVWVFPSLLASFAMMIAEDLSEERLLRACEECSAPFLSSAYQARFCSDRCRHRSQKRRQRKKPLALQLHQEGLSPKEIALRLDLPESEARQWVTSTRGEPT